MEKFAREYLSSATIHGLNYIGNTTKLVRIAWIVVVLLGFSVAGYLIWISFDNWQNDPVSTG